MRICWDFWGKKMRGWEGAEPTSQNRDVGHPALARQTPLRMTNRRGTDRDSEPSAQNDEQKQMRGFFAALRMTNRGKGQYGDSGFARMTARWVAGKGPGLKPFASIGRSWG